MISDYMMPGMNGSELCEKIQTIRKGIPFLIVTGHVSPEINSDGVFRVIKKPVNPDDLVKHVQDSLMARYSGQILKLESRRTRDLDLLVIGGSTGAPKIFQTILENVGRNFPPTVVVQHIPPQFQDSFAKDLAKFSGLKLIRKPIALKLRQNPILSMWQAEIGM